jgi:hypothetical protein
MNVKNLDKWIFDSFPVTREGLALFRMFYVLFILFIISPGHMPFLYYSVYGSLPADLFYPPPGPMMLFEGFAPTGVLMAIEIALMVSLGCLFMGWRTRSMSILVGLLILSGNGFAYSMGKINHDMLLAAVPVVMAFSNWGGAWSMDSAAGRAKNPESWPLALLALMLGFMMFTAGFPKLLGGWLDIHTNATYGHFIKHYFVNQRQDLLSELFLDIENRFFWESLDWATVFFEIGFLFSILKIRTLQFWCALAVVFHFMVMMMLNISFISNLPVYSLFLINWSKLAVSFRKAGSFAGAHPGYMIPAVSVSLLSLYLFGTPLFYLDALFSLESDLLALELLVLLAFLPLAIHRIYRGATELAFALKEGRISLKMLYSSRG